MFITSPSKNPLINFKKYGLNQQKSQNLRGSKFSQKAWFNAWKHKINEKEGAKESYRPCRRKTLQKFWRKTTKILLGAFDRSNRERKSLKNFEKVYEHVRNSVFKKLPVQFSTDRKLDSIDRKCFDWSNTNRAPIETDKDSQQIFYRNFNQSKNRFNRSKFWKNQFFEKHNIIMQKLLKALNFMEKKKKHEYEMKCIFKNTCFEPNFPKIKIFNQDPYIFKLGWSNQRHT